MKAAGNALYPTAFAVWMALAGAASGQSTSTLLMANVWEGTYVCYQGETGLVLSFERTRGGLVGDFAFHPIEENPDVPDGRFKFAVKIEEDGTVVATQSHWIKQPPEYLMVDFSGRLEDDGARFAGTIDFEGCTTFSTAATGVRQPDEGPTEGKLNE